MPATTTYVGYTTTPANAALDQYAASIAAALAAAQAAQTSATTALANAATAQAAADAANAEMGLVANILTPGVAGGQGAHTITTAGTAEQISATSTPCRSVTITAKSANTGRIGWGWSNAVKADGTAGATLAAGESITIAVANVNLLWFNATVNGEGFSYTYTT